MEARFWEDRKISQTAMANFEHGNPNNKLQACGITVGMEVCKKPMRTISTQMLEGILYTTEKRLIIK